MCKVLFVYPNKEGYPIIPLGISILSGILKNAGHEVRLFDITFMVSTRWDHLAREKTGAVKKVDFEKYWGKGEGFDINKEFKRELLSFNPDLTAFSIVENNYGCAKNLFKVASDITKSIIIVGGIFPTVAPDFFIQDDNVDMICMGEGEYAILELANRLDKKQDIRSIDNLIVKKDGQVIRNSFAWYYDWQPCVFQDWKEFDPRHLFKAYDGKMWRTGFFEASRGCPFGCLYCANHTYRKIFKPLGKYHREKPMEYVIEEIAHMKRAYSLELVFFNDENFMMMGEDRLKKFCMNYAERINLPFFMQTRAETLVDEEKVIMLKDAHCIGIGIGVESGSTKIRSDVLKKNTPGNIYIKAFANCKRYRIRTSAYVMLGLPFETENDILRTAEFCKRLNADTVCTSIFAPYHGTELYDICVKNGFIEDKYDEDISVNYSTILNMPQLPKEKLEELYYKFHYLVYKDNTLS